MRAIDADELLENIKKEWCGEKCAEWRRGNCTATGCFVKYAENYIRDMPTLDVKPIVKGHLTPVYNDHGNPQFEEEYAPIYECSVCHAVGFKEKFCSCCGADLRNEESE